MLLLARVMVQYCFSRWRLSASSVVVCNAAGGPAAGRGRSGGRHCTAGQYGYVPLGRYLVRCCYSAILASLLPTDSRGVRFLPEFVCLSVYRHDISKDDAARITKRDIEMFHHEFWKLIICPIAIAYSIGQIIKSFCVCACVCVSVRPTVDTLTVAFLRRFSPNWTQTCKPPKVRMSSLGVNITPPLPLFPPKKTSICDPEVLKTHAKMKNAISALYVHESPKLRVLSEIGVGEHDGDVRFFTGSRNMAV